MRRVVLRLPTCAFYQVSSNLDSIALTILVIVNTSFETGSRNSLACTAVDRGKF